MKIVNDVLHRSVIKRTSPVTLPSQFPRSSLVRDIADTKNPSIARENYYSGTGQVQENLSEHFSYDKLLETDHSRKVKSLPVQ